MSKGHMPGSMDLLLDTMCNTFGGVMFIAISLALAFFISKSQEPNPDDLEAVKQEIKHQQQEQAALESRKQSLTRQLSSYKEFASRNRTTQSGLPEQVTKLEQDCKDKKREHETKNMDHKDLVRKAKALEKENKQLERKIKTRKAGIEKEKTKLKEEFQRLCFIAGELNRKLANTPKRKFHFTQEKHTSRVPFVVVVKDNKLYRLGADYHHSSNEVQVQRIGNHLLLTPRGGTFLPTVAAGDISSLLREFDKSREFLWIIVHPDAFESFVSFRRLLREASLPVHWYVDRELTLELVDRANYSESY